jgi:hypothetical protein
MTDDQVLLHIYLWGAGLCALLVVLARAGVEASDREKGEYTDGTDLAYDVGVGLFGAAIWPLALLVLTVGGALRLAWWLLLTGMRRIVRLGKAMLGTRIAQRTCTFCGHLWATSTQETP